MTPHHPRVHPPNIDHLEIEGQRLVSAMGDLVERLPDGDEDLRVRASTVADRLSSFVAAVGSSLGRDGQPSGEGADAPVVTDREGRITGVDAAADRRAEAQLWAAVLATLSHDLRAPVGALSHQAQLLGSEEISPEVRRRSMEAIGQNARHLAQIMDELTEIERHAQDELGLDPRLTTLGSILDAVAVDEADVDVPADVRAATTAVDLGVVARVLGSSIRAADRHSSSSHPAVTGRVTDVWVEIAVRSPGSVADPTASAPDFSRMPETALTTVVFEAHGGSVTASDRELVLRLPRLHASAGER